MDDRVRVSALKTRKAELEATLAAASDVSPVLRMHPRIAEVYRNKVTHLAYALNEEGISRHVGADRRLRHRRGAEAAATAMPRRVPEEAGRVPETWKDKPAKLRQKDRDLRWTMKRGRVGCPKGAEIMVPAFGCENDISTDRRHGLIRRWSVTHAAAGDGRQLPDAFWNMTFRPREQPSQAGTKR